MSAEQNPVVWFEIPVADLSRAKAFYEAALGIAITEQEMGEFKMGWFPMAPGAPGAGGTLMQCDSYVPSHEGTLVYFPVEDIEATLAKVDDAGGKTLRPKFDIGEYGFVGIFEDSEGNRVGLHTPPANGGC